MTTANLTPIKPTERIDVIDSLRGIAIFGILMVNMAYFAFPFFDIAVKPGAPWYDEAAYFVVQLLFTSKFFTMFSFLFGLGMSVQMARAQEKGTKFLPLYLRRLLVLFFLGLAHAVLLWIGDILLLYALVGTLTVLVFSRARPRTLNIWAVVLITLSTLIMSGLIAFAAFVQTAVPEAAAKMSVAMAQQQVDIDASIAHDLDIYANGNFIEITAERFRDYIELFSFGVFYQAPAVLAMFLIGLAFGKAGRFTNMPENLPFWRRLFWVTLPIGLVINLLYALNPNSFANAPTSLTFDLAALLLLIGFGGPILSLAYISGVVLLSQNPATAFLLKPFAPVGRMALTNYLTHSLVMSSIFMGYGLGLYGQVNFAMLILMGIVLYVLQIPLSAWWLSRFRFGPMEWLWRSLTYLKPQPMRLNQPTASPESEAAD